MDEKTAIPDPIYKHDMEYNNHQAYHQNQSSKEIFS